MNGLSLQFNFKDIFLSPRIAFSGKKIFIFIQGNLFGFIAYWIFSYFALLSSGVSFQDSIMLHGLYPSLSGEDLQWYCYVLYYIGIGLWIISIFLSSTAVSRVTLKQLKGNDFFSGKDSWVYLKNHWHAVFLSPLAIILIILFFIFSLALAGLLGKIPFIGEFFFVLPYLLFFISSIFIIYTILTLVVSLIYSPSIVGIYEEDTMGTVFQSYSITFSHFWRIILYHLILVPLLIIAVELFSWLCIGAIDLITLIFSNDILMGNKILNMHQNAYALVFPPKLFEYFLELRNLLSGLVGFNLQLPQLFEVFISKTTVSELSTTESISVIILSLFYFLIILTIFSYSLSVLTVGETLMFIIFKKISDNDNLLLRQDEDDTDPKVDTEEEIEKILEDFSSEDDQRKTEI